MNQSLMRCICSSFYLFAVSTLKSAQPVKIEGFAGLFTHAQRVGAGHRPMELELPRLGRRQVRGDRHDVVPMDIPEQREH